MYTFFWAGKEIKFSAEETLHGEIFPRRGMSPGGDLFRRNPIRSSFMSYFLLTDSIMRVEMSKVIFRGKFSPGLNCPEDIYVGRGIFPRRWNQTSWRYLKTIRNQIKSKFFQLKVRSNIKTY